METVTMGRHLRRVAALGLVVWWSLSWSAAQPGDLENGDAGRLAPAGAADGGDSGPVRRFVYLDESFELNDLVHKAGFFEMQDNWAKAFEIYQDVLRQATPTTLVRLDDRTFGNLRLHVCRHLASMPEERRHQYRLLYDDTARRLLAGALNPLSIEALDEVATVYFVTSVGDDALDILGDVYRERGEWQRAVAYWRQVLEVYPDTDLPRDRLWAKVAAGYVQLGHRRQAEAALKALRELTGEAGLVTLGGTAVPLVARLESEVTRLEATPTVLVSRDRWPQVGGTAAHVAVGPAPGPVDVPIWTYKVAGGQPAPASNAAYGVPTAAAGPAATMVPVASGSRVFIHDDSTVYALESATGRVAWSHAANLSPQQTTDPRTGRVVSIPGRQQVWQTACAVEDGRVYAVLGNAVQRQAKLVALDEVTGRLVWSATLPPPGSGLTGVIVHTSQVVVADGGVYLRVATTASDMAGYYGGGHQDHHVLAFDARSGRLRWQRFVCTAASLSLPYYGGVPAAPPQLMVPAADARRVYISTNGGAVAALDARTGEVAWATLYEKSSIDPRTQQRMLALQGRSASQEPYWPWRSSAPLVAGERVYFTPTDADALFSLDAETGTLLWQRPREKGQYVAGVRDGLLIVVGDRVEAVDAQTGGTVWRSGKGLKPAGLPLLTQTAVLVPTEDRLYRFDVATGKQLGSMLYKSRDGQVETGNLVWNGESLVTASPTHVIGFGDRSERMAALARRIKADPRDADAYFQRGEIHARTEEYEQAIAQYKTGLSVCPADLRYQETSLRDVFRSRLYEYHLAANRALLTQKKYEPALAHAKDGLGYATTPDLRLVAKLQMVASYEALKDWTQAAAVWQSVLLEEPAVTHTLKDGNAIKASLFAAQRLRDLIAAHGRQPYAAHDAAAARLLAAGNRESLEQVLEAYPVSQSYLPAMLALADTLATAGDFRRAVSYYKRYLREGGAVDRPQTYVKLIAAQEKEGWLSSARRSLALLEAAHPDAMVTMDGREMTALAYVAALRARPEFSAQVRTAEFVLPDLPLPLDRTWTKSLVRPMFVGLPSGAAEDDRLYLHAGPTLYGLEPQTGKFVWQQNVPGMNQIQRAVSDGRSVLVSDNVRVACVELKTGQVEWVRTVPAARGDGQVVVQRNAAGVQVILAGVSPYLTGMDLSEEGALLVRRTVQRVADGRVVTQSEALFLDRGTGEVRWTRTMEGVPYLEPRLLDDVALIPMQNPFRLTALEVDDGTVRKEWALGNNQTERLVAAPVVLSPDTVAVALGTRNAHQVMVYDVQDGSLVWKRDIKGTVNAYYQPVTMERRGEALLFIPRQGTVASLNVADGAVNWQAPLPAATPYPQQVQIGEEAIYLTGQVTERNSPICTVACLDAGTGKLRWTAKLPESGQARDLVLTADHAAVLMTPFKLVQRQVGNQRVQSRVGLPAQVVLLNRDDGEVDATLHTSQEEADPRFSYQPSWMAVRGGQAVVATYTGLVAFGPSRPQKDKKKSQ